jgi:predicted AAA+ superfamily ATPase
MEYQRRLLKTLTGRLGEKRKFIQVIAGPRQTGKTTLARQLFARIKAPAAFHSADDTAEFGPAWIDQVWDALRLELKLKKKREAVLFIDEIQKIANWSETVKKNWDSDTAARRDIKVVLLGSSRLLLENGLSESLLGRFELNYLGHWSFGEMKKAFSFTPEQYVWFGGYPGAAALTGDEERFKNYIRNSVVEPALGRDILMTTRINKPALLRQLFEIGTQYSARILSFTKMVGQLNDAGNTTTLARYLLLLEQAGLMAGLTKYSGRLITEKLSIPKLQVFNTALTSALRPERFEEARSGRESWGHLVESSVGGYLLNQVNEHPGIKLHYWREKNMEMDFVLQSGQKVLALEVKSGTGGMGAAARERFRALYPRCAFLLVGDSGIAFEEFMRLPVTELFEAHQG